jgi:ferredoxin
MVEIRLEKDKCITSGQCVMAAPAVFDQDDEGIVVLLDEDPPESEHAAVREAATVCPAQLIRLAE